MTGNRKRLTKTLAEEKPLPIDDGRIYIKIANETPQEQMWLMKFMWDALQREEDE
jgi:hypothetical protein